MTEGPYKLPSGWRWVRLEETATLIRSGFAFGKKGAAKGNLLHLRPYNIGVDGTLDLSQQFLIPSASKSSEEVLLQPGDVLFNNTNSVELVGKTALVREPINAAFSNHITLMRTYANVCGGAWLALSLRTLWQQGFFAQRCNKWIGQAGYNTQMLQETLIPLPPLAEQRRHVARVESLMARVREAKHLRLETQEDAEMLTKVAYTEIFSQAEMRGWDIEPFSEVWSEKASYGSFKKPSDEETSYSVIRVGNMIGGFVVFDDIKYLALENQELARC